VEKGRKGSGFGFGDGGRCVNTLTKRPSDGKRRRVYEWE
jgi:hypothetical protein